MMNSTWDHPARAGKTRGGGRKGKGNTDHPRACGENKKAELDEAQAAGSPPRVRGKP